MENSPSFHDIAATAGTGSCIGVLLIVFGYYGIVAWESGQVSNLVGVFPIIGFGLFVGLFTAWPIGTAVGFLVMKFLDWGSWQAGVGGALTGLVVGAILTGGAPIWTSASVLVGIISGVVAWRAVIRTADYRRFF